jgi:hypothetical protein
MKMISSLSGEKTPPPKTHSLARFISLGLFEKQIFVTQLERKNSWFGKFCRVLPEWTLLILFLSFPAFQRMEVSKKFYAPRFFEAHPGYIWLVHGLPDFYLWKRGESIYLYEYLSQNNTRFMDLTATVDLRNKVVVDLNAGHGNLKGFLPASSTYKGNDLFPQASHVVEMTDDVFVRSISEKVDVLCAFGWATGGPVIESKTQDRSIEYLIEKFHPEFFVLEAISEYEELFLDRLSKPLGLYKLQSRFEYNSEGPHPRRTMCVFRLSKQSL